MNARPAVTRKIIRTFIVAGIIGWLVLPLPGTEPQRRKSIGQVPREPPQLFELEVEGKTVKVRLDKPFEIVIGERKVAMRLTVKPYRIFDQRGIRFRFPQYFAYSSEDDSEPRTWTVEGPDALLIVQQYRQSDSDDLLRELKDGFVKKYAKNLGIKKASIRLARRELKGWDLDIKVAGTMIHQEVYVLSVENATLALILQDSLDDSDKPTVEFRRLRKMLEETFEAESQE